VPGWLFWLVIGLGFLVAAFLAYHDLRQSTAPSLDREVRRRLGNEIGRIINEGEGLWEIDGSQEGLSRLAADWWNSTGDFIETVLGQAERHIISEPGSAPTLPDLIERHCNLLRGSLQRLPDADLRVDLAELEEAIKTREDVLRA
jgi:hypothetical protein